MMIRLRGRNLFLWAGVFSLAALFLCTPAIQAYNGFHANPGRLDPFFNCTGCHGPNLGGEADGGLKDSPSCNLCHDEPWANPHPVTDGPYTGATGVAILMDGSASYDNDGTITDYSWDFGDGATASGATTAHTYATGGLFDVVLTVTDNDGRVVCTTPTADVTASSNSPPIVDTGEPYIGLPNEPITFDASGTVDPDGDPLIFMWLFPGSQVKFGDTVEFAFAAAGEYVVNLSVSDGTNDPILRDVAVSIVESIGPAYVGDTTCQGCHKEKYDDYILSGHPYKLNKIGGVEPPADKWPASPVPPLPPDGLQWDQVEYVIGNFFWKARFIERDGFIHTGDQVQWNLATQEWVSYHPGEIKPYNCGRCHTTGYQPEGNQDGLPGLVGTWTEPGIRCEACHGPGGDHAASPLTVAIEGGKDCSECHYRDEEFRMPWKGGFMRHHQQGEDFSHSPHADLLSCETCHDPHKSVVYDLGGTITECSQCHPGTSANNNYEIKGMESVTCVQCHMPKIGKSATTPNPYKGDVAGHLFRIMTEPIAAADNTYEADGATFWNQDADGNASITLDYACLGCHTDFDPDMTLASAAEFAKGIHDRQPAGDDWLVKLPFLNSEFKLTFEQFAGILIVKTEVAGAEPSTGIGMEFSGVIFWMDITGDLYFGNIDRPAGTMQGILFGANQAGTVWFAEQR